MNRPRVFLSHQWSDKHIADRLATDLEHWGDVWMDIRKLNPGEPIQRQIDNALEEMDVIMVLWSSKSAASEGVAAEIATGLRLSKPIIPLFIEHGADGRPTPEWPAARYKDFLGIDFFHYGTGVARLIFYLLSVTNKQLPKEAAAELAQTPAATMLQTLQGDADALRYVNSSGMGDRNHWVNKASTTICDWLCNNGNQNELVTILEAMDQSHDPDIIRLKEQLLSTINSAPNQRTGPDPSTPKSFDIRPKAGRIDAIADHLREFLPADQAEQGAELVRRYIANTPVILQSLHQIALMSQSAAGTQVVYSLYNYLSEPNDLIPDSLGEIGQLDDAWLIINTAYRLIESGVVDITMIPVNWADIQIADQLVTGIIPPAILTQLGSILMSYMNLINNEIMAYQPRFTSYGQSYQPLMSGGCFEDQFNAAALGTGLSL